MSEIIESPAITSISNPADQKKLRGNLQEIVALIEKAELLKIAKKIIVDEVKRQFGLSPAHTNALAGVMHKKNYAEIAASQADFEALYHAVLASPQAQREFEKEKANFSADDVEAIVAAYVAENDDGED